MVIKTATYVHSEDFQDKRFLKQCTMFQPPSDFEMKKRAFSQKRIFSGHLQQDIALLENYLEKN